MTAPERVRIADRAGAFRNGSRARDSALLRSVLAALALVALGAGAAAHAGGYDLEVKKSERVLIVREGSRVRARFPIATGRGGPGDKQKLGDNKTPVGTYRIIDVKDKTRFDTFLQINYPNVKDAFYGLKRSLITRGEFDRIVQALRHGQVPPQNTRLGGAIGIHGLTDETPEALHIQDRINWTEGCISLRNQDLHELRSFIDVGTRVVIHE